MFSQRFQQVFWLVSTCELRTGRGGNCQFAVKLCGYEAHVLWAVPLVSTEP